MSNTEKTTQKPVQPTAAKQEMKWPQTLRQEHVNGGLLFANRLELIKSLTQYKDKAVAEIGVYIGDFSEELIKHLSPSTFHGYDVFNVHTYTGPWAITAKEQFKGRTHLQFYEDRFRNEITSSRMKAYEGDSSSRMAEQPDECYDVIYIDGDHTYPGVRKDTDVALKKIKPGGMLVFNDYIMFDKAPNHKPYGVVHVVNDLCVNHGWRMYAFALQATMFCDVALVKR